MPKQSKSGNCRGFTLIEVLVAFSILSLSLAAILSLFSTSTRNSQVVGDYSRAAFFAESKLAELGVSEPLREGYSRGRLDSDMEWEMRINKQSRRDRGSYDAYKWDMMDVSLHIRWESMGKERDLTVTTTRLAVME